MQCTSVLIGIVIMASSALLATPPSRMSVHVRGLLSEHVAVRLASAQALGRFRSAEAVEPLTQALGDADAGVRRQAAKALGFLRLPRARAALQHALGDADVDVRFYAAYALGEIGATEAVPALLARLSDPEWIVRNQVAWALRQCGGEGIGADLVAVLAVSSTDVAHVRWLLKDQLPQQVVPLLTTLLDHAEAMIRVRAVDALGDVRGDAALDPLLQALHDGDRDVRLAALRILSKNPVERLEAPFRHLAAEDVDPLVREAAVNALRQLALIDGLVAYWSFDDGDVKVARDMTGRGVDGKVIGATAVAGKVGAALAFRQGTVIELGRPAALPIGQRPLTMMAWVKSEQSNGVVVARGGAFCGFSLYLKDGFPKFGIHRVQDGPAYIAAGPDSVVGRWVHLAGVIGAKGVSVYVDGTLVGKTKTPGFLPGDCGQGTEIGYDAVNSPAEIIDHFVGIIDEVKVFHAALSAKDIGKHMRKGQ